MGGYGSGRSAWRNQGTVDGGYPLDVLALRREHGFGPTAVGVTIPYTDKAGSDAQQHVRITWTACRFGGFRPWFECPDCSSRRVKLYREYRPVGELGEWRLGRAFCRRCYPLTYQSQRETWPDRRLRRAWRITKRLGSDNIEYADKPKGMHWRTYNRLMDELGAARWDFDTAVARWLAKRAARAA